MQNQVYVKLKKYFVKSVFCYYGLTLAVNKILFKNTDAFKKIHFLMANFFQNNIFEKILKILQACIKTQDITLRLNILFI